MDLAQTTTPRALVIGITKAEMAASRQLQRLQEMDYQGMIVLEQISTEFRSQSQINDEVRAVLGDYDILLLKPTRLGHLSRDAFENAKEGLIVATLSRRTDHLNIIPLEKRATILSVKGVGNAPDVAELTMSTVVEALRPVHSAQVEMNQGKWNKKSALNASRLAGKTWLSVGAGNIPRYLLPRIVPWGLERIFLVDHKLERDRFELSLSEIPSEIICYDKQTDVCRAEIKISNSDTLEVVGVRFEDLPSILKLADIVSLHVPFNPTEGQPDHDGLRPVTANLVDRTFLNQLKDGVVLVNPSHGDIVSEEDLVEALKDQSRALIYIGDLVCMEAERSGNFRDSKLWMHAVETAESLDKDLYLLPHLGGTTKEALEATIKDVLDQLFSHLSMEASGCVGGQI